MRRTATLCAACTFTLLAPLAPAQAADGALDPTFGTLGQTRAFFDQGTTDEDRGHDVAVDALGRIVVVGIVDVAGVKRWGVTRLLPNGALDTSFSVGGVPADGKLVLDTYVADPAYPPVVAVWNRPGDDPGLRNHIAIAGGVVAPDPAAFCTVNADGSSFACGHSVFLLHNDRYVDIEVRGSSVYLGANIDAGGNNRDLYVERRLTTAFPWPHDPSFVTNGLHLIIYNVPGGTGRDELGAIDVTADGEIILVGSRSSSAGNQDLFWVKLNPDATATVYEGFRSLGVDDLAFGLAVAPDESFYISGSSSLGGGGTLGVLTYVMSDGTLGVQAGADGGAFTDVVLQSDGKPVAIAPGNAPFPGFRIARYSPQLSGGSQQDVSFSGGSVGYTFADGPGADASLGRSLALQGGRIIAAGEAEWNAPDFDFGVMRLESSPVFSDGFEVGSASAWSTVAP